MLLHYLAPNTVKTYSTGVRHYLVYCNQLLIQALPIYEQVLENFVVSMAPRVGFKTIKVYLCGVQVFAVLNRCLIKIRDMTNLKYVLRGIRRSQGSSHTRLPKDPITLPQLRHLGLTLAATRCPADRKMFTAALLTAFFGMLRVSEYTSPSVAAYDPTTHLCVNDVSINWQRRIMIINIKVSKTDPFRQGATVRIPVLNNDLCPVMAMIRYLAVRPNTQGPLFRFANGRFLTRAHITSLLVTSFPNNPRISSHSFRRGGATALARVGTPDYIVQLLGRWQSDAYLSYISLPDNFFATTFKKLARRADTDNE